MIVDCRGRRCPLPILDLARRIGEVAVGRTLTIEADDPAAPPDVRAWCRMTGHEFVAQATAADGAAALVVRRLR
ncbi:MAG: sulfurtransferase TusA family protein [Jatrophihabitans sp.]|nr:MAG: sulfurtransferase TusA family protein [Jatrophihabitans sp.]